jgi:hypothetical protein
MAHAPSSSVIEKPEEINLELRNSRIFGIADSHPAGIIGSYGINHAAHNLLRSSQLLDFFS